MPEWLECQRVLEWGGGAKRDLALYLGRRLCGMKLAELAQAVGLRNYGVVATNAIRYERRLEQDRAEKARMKQVLGLWNCVLEKFTRPLDFRLLTSITTNCAVLMLAPPFTVMACAHRLLSVNAVEPSGPSKWSNRETSPLSIRPH
ncbi:MAG: hypothetical protein FJ398_09080 [Verrucomicrobia bacterium]|nr:hypothetical protein [Verrucomicrobiota bacterium]